MTSVELRYLTLAIPAGPLYGNTPFVEYEGDVYANVPTPQARWELAEAPFVVVTVGAGRREVPAGRDEAERETLSDSSPRRGRLVPVGARWMRVEWLPDEPDPAVGLVRAAVRFALSLR